jgi:hypothetical protein
MQDKVGSKVPSEAEIAKLVDVLGDVRRKMDAWSVSLTDEERRRVLRFPGGGDAVIALMSRLARKHGVSLPGVDVDAMDADLLLLTRIAPLLEALDALGARASDTAREAGAEAWWSATAIYTALSRTADADPELQAEIKPATQFFARPRKRQTPPSGT